MLGDIGKAVGQLSDPRFRFVLVKSLALTVGLLIALVWLVGRAASLIPPIAFTIPLLGWEVGFLDEAARGLALGAGLALSAVLMFPVAAAFTGFFLEDIAEAVEARHYWRLPPARRQPLAETLVQAARFTAVLIGANLLALLVYLILLPIAWIPFLAVNGYLLGREYFELVAARRLPPAEVLALRRRHMVAVWLAGVAMAAPLSIPILNLIVPLVGVAAFTHMVHRLAAFSETDRSRRG